MPTCGGIWIAGIEQDEPLDAVRRGRRRLVGDPAAERVAEPGRRPGRRSLEHVGDVLLEIPGRLPRRAAVPAQVEGDDVEAVRQALRELLEVPPVARDAVQADERRQALVAPLVPGEAQVVVGASGPETSSVRRVSASLTRLQTTTPVLSIRKVPRTAAPRVSSKTPYALAASPCGQKSERERVGEAELLLPRLARGRRVARNEDDVGLGALERRQVLLQVARLLLAHGRERERVEDEQDVALAAEVRQPDALGAARPRGRSPVPHSPSRSSSASSPLPEGR